MAIDSDFGDLATQALQESAWLQCRRMFNCAGDDMRPARPAPEEALQLGEDGALDGIIARLGAAAGEDDFLRLRAEQRGHLGAGMIDGVMGSLAVDMRTGRVAEV